MTTPMNLFYTVRFVPTTASWALSRDDGNGTNWSLGPGTYLVQLHTDMPEEVHLNTQIDGVWEQNAAVIAPGTKRVSRSSRMVTVNIPKGKSGFLRVSTHNGGAWVPPTQSTVDAKCGASISISRVPELGDL